MLGSRPPTYLCIASIDHVPLTWLSRGFVYTLLCHVKASASAGVSGCSGGASSPGEPAAGST